MIIAVDFDGTIVEHDFPYIGKPILFAIEALKKLQEDGHKLILWTVREGKYLEEAIDYCKERGLVFYAENKNLPDEEQLTMPRKLVADLFIDDRNIGGLPDWTTIYNTINSGDRAIFDFNEFLKQNTSDPQNIKKNFFIRLGETLDKARNKKS